MEGWQYKLAFVVQFRSETDPEAGKFEGKVEHVASCERTRFNTLEELLEFMTRVLADVRLREEL